MEETLTCSRSPFSQVFGRQGQLMRATVQSLNNLNDQIASFMVTRPKSLEQEQQAYSPPETETLQKSMNLMRHLLVDAQAKILKMMDDNKQLAHRIDGAIQSASQEVTNLRSELSATSRRLAELGATDSSASMLETVQHNHNDHSPHHKQKPPTTELCYKTEISSLMDFNSPDASLDKVLLREEVAQLQQEVHLLRQMKDMLSKDLEETQRGCSADVLSATELRVQLAQKEEELDRAKEALQAMKSDRKRLKAEKADLVNQMQQLYATLESREEQLRDFIRNYEQHRKSEDAVKALAKEKDLLEREKWDLRRQTKEATEHTGMLRSQLDLKENRIKELEAELAMMSNCVNQRMEFRVFERLADRDYSPRVMAAKQSLATLTKDVPKRHSLAMPTEAVVNGNNQEWVMQADLPLTAAIRQSQQTLYVHTGHPTDRQVAAVRVSPIHSRQPSVISDASAVEGDRSSTPSDINSPRHRTHSLCNSLEDLEEAKRKKKKEKMGLGSLSRVFARGKQRKSLDPGLFDDSDSLYSLNRLSLSDGSEDQLDRLQQVELARTTPMSQWRAGTVQAWLEVVMAMPMYIRTCSENVKSGKVLLGLNDEDLELGLGVSSLMHRRKLCLAIEDYRDAENGKELSKAADLDHHWVAKAWLSDVGLPQYSQAFHTHLVDGRMLNSLTRRDLERHLNITKKFHQVSLLLGIELLQSFNFDKEVLQARRIQSEHQNDDPLVWTSHRVMKWIKDIDLKEYADILLSSGVHGAVMMLDPSFNTDSMAAVLGIPSSKQMVRRHLDEEMRALIGSARANAQQSYDHSGIITPPTPLRQNSLTRPPSSNPRHTDDEGSLRRRAIKPPMGFSSKNRGGRDLSCHSSFGSLPRDVRDRTPPRAEGSPIRGYSSIEITNV
ncbi:kazrin-A isoform X2 [Girardinichthys multiradiatus]|uniref:kazrin-A isoform X2 n=1 Tax=Girardinichthys multiradiatus TaxID=208333 RepID=UPI001FAD6610|nr:kazrin-A isoform X2 [Girardinichthys multiradiatus]